ncbi:MAG TPA: diguanylate cyclase [Gemmataceae bacterium]|nr:diguanylate cyclase [Gemmataceae bacterium]
MPAPHCSLLIVDDEPLIVTALATCLNEEFEILTAPDAERAQKILASRPVDLVLTDQNLPGMTGVQLLEWVKQNHPQTIRLLMSGYASYEATVQAINTGQVYRYLFKPWRAEELRETLREAARQGLLQRKNEQLLGEMHGLNRQLEERVRQRTRELEEANYQLQQKNWMLEKLALTDPLTGLPNRRAVDGLLQSELQRRDRYPSALTVGLIDIDHFKELNARYLWPGGDQVLIGLAKTFLASLRAVDSIGRIGGEEFLLVAPETGLEGARILGDRLRATVEESQFFYKGEVMRVTISLGLVVVEENVPAELEALRHATALVLQEAKTTGRNRAIVSRFEPSQAPTP